MRTAASQLLFAALLAATALGADESLTVHVQADGRGKLEVEHTYDEATSARLLEGVTTAEAQRRRVEDLAAERLASWRGVEVWTGIQATATDGKVRLRATGWFEDLSQVAEVLAPDDAPPRQAFALAREGTDLEVRLLDGEVTELPGVELETVLEQGAEGVKLMRELTRSLGQELARGAFRRARVVVMPAAITRHSGFSTVEDRRASQVQDGAALLEVLDRAYAKAEDVARRLEAGELTEEGARAELAAAAAAPLVVAAPLPAAAEQEAAAASFTASLTAARGAWTSSVWRGRLERARARPSPATESPPPAPTPATEPAPALAPDEEEPRAPAPAPRASARPTRRVTATAFEPNDGPAQATPLAPGLYRGMELGREDWYRLDVPERHEVRVVLTFDPRATDLELALVGQDGATVLATSQGLGGRERLRVVSLTGGAHLLRVHAAPGWAGGAAPAYRLDVDVQPFTPADRFEPNEPPHAPAALEPGPHADLVCTGEDRYALIAAVGSRVEVSLTFSQDDGDLDLSLLDAGGRVLADAAGPGDGARAACLAPADGRVLVRVRGDEGTPYTLRAGLNQGPAPDAFEPNDAPSAARALPPGTHANLLLEADDWYRVDVPAGKVLRVTASFKHAAGDLDLALHREDGALLRASTGQTDQEQVDLVRPGPVLVRVHGGSGSAEPSRYTLTVALVAFQPADRLEPNDVPEAARDLAPGEHADLRCTVEDWYRVALKKGQRLRAVVALDPALGDLDLELVDPSGRTLAASTGLGEREEATVVADVDGPVLVRVYRNEAPYRLTIAVE
jgi:hypothetical protein